MRARLGCPIVIDGDSRCPCLTGETYARCCGRFHAASAACGRDVREPGARVGAPGSDWPATAEALMRSRYSAFAAGLPDYLLATWHPSTRPAKLELDVGIQWRRLDVVRVEAGGPFDDTGIVEFAAHYRSGAERGIQREVSRFVREDGRWYYLDAMEDATTGSS